MHLQWLRHCCKVLLLQQRQILLVAYLLPSFPEQNALRGSAGVWRHSGKQQPCPGCGQTDFSTGSISCTLSSSGSSSFPLGLLLSLQLQPDLHAHAAHCLLQLPDTFPAFICRCSQGQSLKNLFPSLSPKSPPAFC